MRGLSDVRGVTVVEMILIIGALIAIVMLGLRFLGQSTKGALTCQGQMVLNLDGTSTCAPGGSLQASNTPLPTADKPPRWCNGLTCFCFVAGTKVVTSQGLQNIEEVAAGTLVLSRSEAGELDWRPVQQSFVSHSRSLVRLTTVNEGGFTESFETTGRHPFFVEGRGWVHARDLVPGEDSLVDRGDRPVRLIHAESVDRQVPVYNFEVAEFHTYFVGESAIWVHNRPIAIGDGIPVHLNPGAALTGQVVEILPGDLYRVRIVTADGHVMVTTVNHLGRPVFRPRPPDTEGPAAADSPPVVNPPPRPLPNLPVGVAPSATSSGLPGTAAPYRPSLPPAFLSPIDTGAYPATTGEGSPTSSLGGHDMGRVSDSSSSSYHGGPMVSPDGSRPGSPVRFPGDWAIDVQPQPVGRWRLAWLRRPGNPVGRPVPLTLPGPVTVPGEITAKYPDGSFGVTWDDGTNLWSGVVSPNGVITHIDGRTPDAPSPAGDRPVTMTFMVQIQHESVWDTIRTSHTGHSFIQLDVANPADLPAAWRTEFPRHYALLRQHEWVIGKFARDNPLVLRYTTDPGRLADEGRPDNSDPLHAPAATKTYQLTLEEAERLFEYVDRTYHDDFNFCRANCTTWAAHAVEAAGHKPPDNRLMGVMGFPSLAYQDIKKNADAGHPGAHAWEMMQTNRILYEKNPDGNYRLVDGNRVPLLDANGLPRTEIREAPAIPLGRPPSPELIADTASSVFDDLPPLPPVPPPKPPLATRLTAPIRNTWQNVSNRLDRRPRPVEVAYSGAGLDLGAEFDAPAMPLHPMTSTSTASAPPITPGVTTLTDVGDLGPTLGGGCE